MGGPYQTYVSGADGSLAIPTWLLDPQGNQWLQAVGQTKDFLLQRVLAGVQARFPGLAPGDALDLIGEERLIPRAPGELDANYSQRLIAAWNTWTRAGTEYGLLLALQAGGYTCTIVRPQLAFSLDASNNLVQTPLPTGAYFPAGHPAPFWSAFDLIIGPSNLPAGWPPVPSVTSVEAQRIFQICKLWKAAHAYLAHVIIIQSGWFLGIPPITFLHSTTPVLGGAVFTVWNAGF